MDMKRKILDSLLKWKLDPKRKPLILQGARQTGKTHSLLEFANTQFSDHIYINFEKDRQAYRLFEGSLDPARIVAGIEEVYGREVVPGQTLLIFDEIQLCGLAVTSLKYFMEDMPKLHVVSAGSLLGVSLNRQHASFPVGKVNFLNLYPLDFEEFLWAHGKQTLATAIREAFANDEPLNAAAHANALNNYDTYFLCGGMPAAVKEHAASGSLLKVRPIQDEILLAYQTDMNKYATTAEASRIQRVFMSIPEQLAKENSKFQYSKVVGGGRASQFQTSMDWLVQAGIGYPCRKVNNVGIPLSRYADSKAFKFYMADIGLLCALSEIPIDYTVVRSTPIGYSFIPGDFAENYVAQCLVSQGYSLYYWQSKSQAELDFILGGSTNPIPVEVKAGKNVRSKSLDAFRETHDLPLYIRLSLKNFGHTGTIKSVPLYAAFLL